MVPLFASRVQCYSRVPDLCLKTLSWQGLWESFYALPTWLSHKLIWGWSLMRVNRKELIQHLPQAACFHSNWPEVGE